MQPDALVPKHMTSTLTERSLPAAAQLACKRDLHRALFWCFSFILRQKKSNKMKETSNMQPATFEATQKQMHMCIGKGNRVLRFSPLFSNQGSIYRVLPQLDFALPAGKLGVRSQSDRGKRSVANASL